MFGQAAAAALNAGANATLLQAAEQGSEQGIEQAIAAGADVHFLDPAQNTTAIHQAAKAGAARAIELLVRANADVNKVNSVNATPLIYAVQKGHVDAVKTLLALGARKELLTRKGKSALALAQEKAHTQIIALLSESGAAPAAGGGLFSGGAAPAAGGGLFGSGGTSAAGGGLFGGAAPAGPGASLYGGGATPAAGGGLFGGGGAPVACGGMFGGGSGVPAAGATGAPLSFGSSVPTGAPLAFGAAPGGLGSTGGSGFGAPQPVMAFGVPPAGALIAPKPVLASANPAPLQFGGAAAGGGGPFGFGSGGGGGGFTAGGAPGLHAAGASRGAAEPPARLPSPPEAGVSALAFRSALGAFADGSAGGDLLAASGWDGTVRVWDVAGAGAGAAVAPALVRVFAASCPALAVAWAADGSALLRGSADGGIARLDLRAGGGETAVGSHGGGVCTVHTTSAMPSLVLSGSWDATLCSWDVRAGGGKPATACALGARVLCAALSWPHALVGVAQLGSVLLFDLRKPSEPLRTDALDARLRQPPRCVAIAPGVAGADGDFSYAVGTYEGRAAVRRAGAAGSSVLKCHCAADGSVYAVNALAYSSRDGTLLSAGSDGVLRTWDVSRQAEAAVHELAAAEQSVSCAVFNGEGSAYAYAVSYDWTRGDEGYEPTKAPQIWIERAVAPKPAGALAS